MTRWAILTGEYPPQPGGVSDYARCVSRELAAAGDAVRIYAPAIREPEVVDAGVEVHRLPGSFGPRSLLALDRHLSRTRPDRILVQYVPHAFGWKAMNLPFAAWLAARATRIAPVWVMFHEVALGLTWRPVRHAVVGVATQFMARLVAGAADRVFVSTPAWGDLLRRICPRRMATEWLPVPSLVEVAHDPGAVADVRSRIAHEGTAVLGHFGTFGAPITAALAPALVEVLRLAPKTAILLIGRHGERFARELAAAHPDLTGRVTATGELESRQVSMHLQACDAVLQPYSDGITTRRTTAMAVLAHGLPLVSNLGRLSEPLWESGGVAVAPRPDPIELANLSAALLANPTVRAELGSRAAQLYRERFAVEHTITRLRANP